MADPINFNLSMGRILFSVRGRAKPVVFVIHGHDHTTRDEVVAFLRDLAVTPVVLDEQPSSGLTIIEKFEKRAREASLAIGLLTPDDVGHPRDAPDQQTLRARQNVLFELGYFLGALGREKVFAIRAGDVEVPSDFQGVVYIPKTSNREWKIRLAQEIEQAGVPVGNSVFKALLRAAN